MEDYCYVFWGTWESNHFSILRRLDHFRAQHRERAVLWCRSFLRHSRPFHHRLDADARDDLRSTCLPAVGCRRLLCHPSCIGLSIAMGAQRAEHALAETYVIRMTVNIGTRLNEIGISLNLCFSSPCSQFRHIFYSVDSWYQTPLRSRFAAVLARVCLYANNNKEFVKKRTASCETILFLLDCVCAYSVHGDLPHYGGSIMPGACLFIRIL